MLSQSSNFILKFIIQLLHFNCYIKTSHKRYIEVHNVLHFNNFWRHYKKFNITMSKKLTTTGPNEVIYLTNSLLLSIKNCLLNKLSHRLYKTVKIVIL